MDIFFDVAIALALLAVVASLFMGLFSMIKGGEYALANSNKFMRYRVWMQAIAVAIIACGFVYKASHH